MTDINIVPVLLGADLNCYNMARAFYEEYGVVSHMFGRYPISATKYSRFIKPHFIKDLDCEKTLVSVLLDFAGKQKNSRLILVGCTDDYALLVSKLRPELEPFYTISSPDYAIMEKLEDKADFYEICDKYNIPYPKTRIFSKDYDEKDLVSDALGFTYPLIIKPSNSIECWKHPFDGMKKVYIAASKEESAGILRSIYASGYSKRVIVQDLIPGDDSNMRVLTAYSASNAKVCMTCLGHVILEIHTPKGRGNHAAIITETDSALTELFRRMLDDIGYTGFSNFDLKYDSRDNTIKVFEINLRQGRSNYYVTSSGANLAKLLIDDRILNKSMEYAPVENEHFWHSVPKRVVYDYVADKNAVMRAKKLVKEGKSSSSFWNKADFRGNLPRLALVSIHLLRQRSKFRKYPYLPEG